MIKYTLYHQVLLKYFWNWQSYTVLTTTTPILHVESYVVFTWPKTEFIYFTDFNVKLRKFSTSDAPDPIWVAASNGAYPRTLPQNPHSAVKPTTPPLSACRHFCRNLRVDTAVVICSLMQLRIPGEPKKIPPYDFCWYYSNAWEFLYEILHDC